MMFIKFALEELLYLRVKGCLHRLRRTEGIDIAPDIFFKIFQPKGILSLQTVLNPVDENTRKVDDIDPAFFPHGERVLQCAVFGKCHEHRLKPRLDTDVMLCLAAEKLSQFLSCPLIEDTENLIIVDTNSRKCKRTSEAFTLVCFAQGLDIVAKQLLHLRAVENLTGND